MYQGQLCRISRRDGVVVPGGCPDLPSGWYLRLRKDDAGHTGYFRVGALDEEETYIQEGFVDNSMSNMFSDRPYETVCVVPTELQSRVLRVSDDIDRIVRADFIKHGKRLAKDRIMQYQGELEQLNKEREDIQAKLDEKKEVLERLDNLEKHIDDMNSGYFLYAYAKHPGQDKEYRWFVPPDLSNFVRVGSHIKVETSRGEQEAVVTRLMKCPYALDHKVVTSVSVSVKVVGA